MTVSSCIWLLPRRFARAAQFDPYPVAAPVSSAMGATVSAVAPNDESPYFNLPSCASFQKFALTACPWRREHCNSYFSLMDYLNGIAANLTGDRHPANVVFAEGAAREFDEQWFGLGADIVNASILFRGFGLLFRERFFGEFTVDRGLLFPFALAH